MVIVKAIVIVIAGVYQQVEKQKPVESRVP